MRQAQARRRHVGEEVEAACGVDISLLARGGGGLVTVWGGGGGSGGRVRERRKLHARTCRCCKRSRCRRCSIRALPAPPAFYYCFTIYYCFKCAASTYCFLLLPTALLQAHNMPMLHAAMRGRMPNGAMAYQLMQLYYVHMQRQRHVFGAPPLLLSPPYA